MWSERKVKEYANIKYVSLNQLNLDSSMRKMCGSPQPIKRNIVSCDRERQRDYTTER